MRIVYLAVVCLALIVMPGCWVFSANPIDKNPEHAIVDSKLIGDWVQPETGCTLSIHPSPESASPSDKYYYKIAYTSPALSSDNCLIDPGIVRFEGLLFQVGDSRFLDLSLDREVERQRPDSCCMLPLDTVMKVVLNQKGLSLVPMKANWFEHQWRSNKPSPRVLDTDIDTDRGPVILTASPEELRTFLKEHQNDSEVFEANEATSFVSYEEFLKRRRK